MINRVRLVENSWVVEGEWMKISYISWSRYVLMSKRDRAVGIIAHRPIYVHRSCS